MSVAAKKEGVYPKALAMPTYKPELTRNEQAKYLSIAKELETAGTKFEIPDEWQENSRFLHIMIAGSPESLITQICPSIVLYAFRVRLLAERGVTVQEFEVAANWDPGISPCYSEGRTPYRLAPALDFNVKEVLNDRIERGLRFRRGDLREGWLLAIGNKPVPEKYTSGRPAPLDIVLVDQFSDRHVVTAEFLVERSGRSTGSVAKPKTSLFERAEESNMKEHSMGNAGRLPGLSVSDGACNRMKKRFSNDLRDTPAN